MGWFTTPELDRFAAAAGGYLIPRAAENILLLSAAQAVRAATRAPAAGERPAADAAGGLLFGWWEPSEGGDPRGAFLHDPAAPLLVSGRVPEMARSLAALLSGMRRPVSGVDAPTEAADAFAAAWSQRAGTSVRVHRNCQIYRLAAGGLTSGAGQATAPGIPGPAGRLRVATARDQPLLAGWLAAFAAETAERAGSPLDLAAELIRHSGAIFWEVPQYHDTHYRAPGPAAEPVYTPAAFAALSRPVPGTVRISMVYTPPERRGRGFASAVTLAVSRALLASGPAARPLAGPGGQGGITEVVMITDLGRQDRWAGRLGFQLVSERAVLRFGPVTGPATGPVPRLGTAGHAPRLPTGPLPRLPRLHR
jgi:hypothetical protein